MKLAIGKLAVFQEEPVPEKTRLAGWAALIQALAVEAPLRRLACVSEQHVGGTKRAAGKWDVYDKRLAPEDTLSGHLTFALRHEVIDLLVLKRVFLAIDAQEIAAIVRKTPNGAIARRLWFFYETLLGKTLDLEDSPTVTAVDALNPKQYFTLPGKLSVRHRVRDNLLGTGAFCPIIRRTHKLERLLELDLARRVREITDRKGHILDKAASSLLLADSRASFEIEGERPQINRLQRWGRAVLEAGKRPLNQIEIYRLHSILIGDDRFTQIGYRTQGVFLGERDFNNDPLPEFIGARPSDLTDLMSGLNACNNRMRRSKLDAVLQATVIAFGFVYIHPLADGNGRLHRCLIHHVLAERGFAPQGMVFPVSSVMLERIEEYRRTLQAQTGPLMNYITWRTLPDKNVEVTNDTADLYRYFDYTADAEFLYSCVHRTIENDLPRAITLVRSQTKARDEIMNLIEIPDRIAQDLIFHIRQNSGVLSKNRRSKQFEKLTVEEIAAAEEIVRTAFADFDAKFGADSAPDGNTDPQAT